jgi:molybdopterin molybdotransferase
MPRLSERTMTEVAEAEALILQRMPRLTPSRRPLAEAAGRVLAQDVLAERDQPPFDRVTMDGIAILHRDWAEGARELEAVGTQGAGAPALEVGPGQCVEVMTGAMLPAGADTVVPVERLERMGNAFRIAETATVVAGQNIHRRGSDRAAGERVIASGSRVGPPEMAVLASAGCAEVALATLPRAAVISTGNELVDVDEPLAVFQIRSSNDRAIETSLDRHGVAAVTRARLADDPHLLLAAIEKLHDEHDLLILSGGVSMGQYDYVPAVLERLGATVVFHRIEQRPGKPMWFGMSHTGKPLFALPGNPVSTLVCLTRYVVPALRRAAGEPAASAEIVLLAEDVELAADLTQFMPVELAWPGDGTALARPKPTNTSGDFVSLVGTDGFVELPRTRRLHPKGSPVRLFRW